MPTLTRRIIVHIFRDIFFIFGKKKGKRTEDNESRVERMMKNWKRDEIFERDYFFLKTYEVSNEIKKKLK